MRAQLNVSLEQEDVDAIKDEAKRQDVSVATLVRNAVLGRGTTDPQRLRADVDGLSEEIEALRRTTQELQNQVEAINDALHGEHKPERAF